MKKILLAIACLVVGIISGIIFTVEIMKVDIVSETEEGTIVRIVVLNQWFNHYVEKGEM
jgi:hypothetical protein